VDAAVTVGGRLFQALVPAAEKDGHRALTFGSLARRTPMSWKI